MLRWPPRWRRRMRRCIAPSRPGGTGWRWRGRKPGPPHSPPNKGAGGRSARPSTNRPAPAWIVASHCRATKRMPVLNRIADFAPEMTEWRQDLHAHPELGFQETRTSEFVAAKLAEWGIEVHRGIATTGL